MKSITLVISTLITFIVLFSLATSCVKNTPTIPTQLSDTKTNCDSIHIRLDGNNTFYENNPTYQNIENNAILWQFATYSEANIDSAVFHSGTVILEVSPTLFSFLLIRDGKILSEKYYNGSNPSHSNNVHSASKCIISALIGIAIDKGYINGINQKILEFFPDYIPNEALKEDITIEHLLNMTSGFTWEEDYTEYFIENEEDWVKAILDLPMDSAPGTVFNYSTGNIHLLSAILQKATGISNCDFIYSNLMSYLGVVIEHWGRDPQGYFSGGYNFYITPRELAKFGLLYLNNGLSNSRQIIPQNWVNTSLSQQINVDSKYDYSYCWWATNILGHDVYKAWGYGGQYICLIPNLDIVIVSTANTSGVYNQLDIDNFIEQYVIPAIQ
ncbi:MAG: serine hydrolase [Mariniphaga sp.]|nr:serine hydrolase [Mariniphaga sp.]